MTAAAHLPPGPRWPMPVQGLAYLASRRRFMHALGKRYGSAFTVKLPFFGPTVIISDPALVKQFFQTRTDVVRNVEPNLDLVLGPGSTFGLQDEEHRRRRKLLVPPFHGKRMRAYENLVEEETLKEIATWPEGREFAVLPSTNRITLNVILRAVFGAEGAEFDALRKVMPPLVALGSQLVFLPWLHRDLGRWSPWGRFLGLRREFDVIVGSLIDRVAADPNLEQRDDVLSLMLQSRYEDGTAMSRSDLADELFTLLAAGHETTATQLAWAVERLRRHPGVLSRLVDEVDAGGSDLLQATINEVQRNRPVIDGAARQVIAPTNAVGAVGDSAWLHRPGRYSADPPERLPGPRPVRPGPIHGIEPGSVLVGAVRRRHPPLPGRRVREHGDERRAAHDSAGVSVGADEFARRSACTAAASHSRRAEAAAQWSIGGSTAAQSDEPKYWTPRLLHEG